MKKILFLLAFAFSFSAIAQQGYRYNVVPGFDNTYTIPHKEIANISYASTKTLAPTMEETTYDFAQLTGNMTVSVTITPCYTGDKMVCLFKADATNRTVTFSTGFTSNGPLIVLASSYTSVEFVFNGSKWYEKTRTPVFANALIRRNVSTDFTGNASVTAAQLAGGLLTITSGTDTLTLPTATLLATQMGASAGTVFDFVLQNTASGGTALLVVNTGITAASAITGGTSLSLANSATAGMATFRISFISSSAATISRLN